MKDKFSNLSTYSKTFVLAIIVELFVAFVFLMLAFFGILNFFVPLGIAIGCGFSATSYAILNVIDGLSESDKKLKFTMTVLFGRLFLLVGLTLLEVFIQLKGGITLFNPFGFIGSYFVTSAIYGIVYLKEKKQ